MKLEAYFNNIQQFIDLNDADKQTISSYITYKEIPKKTYLLREGTICKFEAYVIKGCIRSFYVNESGQETTIQFAMEDWWVSDNASFQYQTPSKIFIEVMEDCELLIFTPESKEKILAELPKMERYYRLVVQRHMAALQMRIINNISMNATARYLDFINTYPCMIARVPQYYIASYLGMSAEFISKIRKRLGDGKVV